MYNEDQKERRCVKYGERHEEELETFQIKVTKWLFRKGIFKQSKLELKENKWTG